MFENHHLLLAFFTGFVSGFAVSVPVGPINITILHEGVQRGFRWALLIGAGAVAMETIYCAIGAAGFSGLFANKLMRAAMELITFTLMLYLGIRYVRAKSMPGTSVQAELIERKLHPHAAFLIGFVRVAANPNVLLFWITLSATFVSHEWVRTDLVSKSWFVGGVALGAASWFLLLSFGVSRGQGRISDRTLLRLSRLSGVFLLTIAVIVGYQLVVQLARR
jgi:threonine/homoserine/homoserine lactone efflux protein